MVAGSAMTSIFHIRSMTCLPISTTQSRVELSITDNTDVEDSDESIALSLLIRHKVNPSPQNLQSAALKRAQNILASQHHAIPASAQKPSGLKRQRF
jgi:hypothetical protein